MYKFLIFSLEGLMKIFILSILISFSVLAGDMGLVCESPDGERIYTEVLGLNNSAKVEFTDSDIYGDEFKYRVTATLGDKTTYNIFKVFNSVFATYIRE